MEEGWHALCCFPCFPSLSLIVIDIKAAIAATAVSPAPAPTRTGISDDTLRVCQEGIRTAPTVRVIVEFHSISYPEGISRKGMNGACSYEGNGRIPLYKPEVPTRHVSLEIPKGITRQDKEGA